MSSRARLAPLTHQPALDGIRGVAILAVLVYHLGYADAGFLGVDLFFVLSGFLITRILLSRLDGSGSVGLRSFWVGRMRRLLPAALVTIAAIGVLGAAGVFASPTLRGDLGAALGYVGNWRLVLTGDDYADQFGPTSPVRHVWSLAVEEQFYLVWPLLLAGVAVVARRRRWPLARSVFVVAAGLAVVSAVLLWHWYEPGAISRAYYGTDSRMFGPLIGAALAVVTARRPPESRPWRRLELGAFVVLAAAGVAVAARWTVTTDTYYRGGAVVFALGCAAVIAVALARPLTPLRWAPLCWVGAISYGLYLYHWPIFALLSPQRTGWADPWLPLARLAVTFAVAAASAVWLERPIREGRLPAGLPHRLAPAALGVGVAAAVVAIVAVPVPAPLVDLTTIDLAEAPPSIPAPPPTTPGAPAPTAVATGIDGGLAYSLDGAAMLALAASMPTETEAPATDPTTTPAAPTTAAPTTTAPAGPFRIMVVGDSVGNNVGAGLERWASGRSDVLVWNRAMAGCGFELDTEVVDAPQSLPRCHDWINSFGSFVDQFRPDVVLVVASHGDQELRIKPDWEAPQRVGDAGFDDLLSSAYTDALGRLDRDGTTVVLATYPCLDEVWVWRGQPTPDGRMANERNAAFNGFLRSLGRPMVDLDAHVCPGGRFTIEVEGVIGARPDGLHFSDDAADALAPWLVDQLQPYR